MASTQTVKSAAVLASFGVLVKNNLIKSYSSRKFFTAGYARPLCLDSL